MIPNGKTLSCENGGYHPALVLVAIMIGFFFGLMPSSEAQETGLLGIERARDLLKYNARRSTPKFLTQGKPLGEISGIIEDVQICAPDQRYKEVCFKAQAGDKIFQNDVIKTRGKGRAGISYYDEEQGNPSYIWVLEDDAYGMRYTRKEDGPKKSIINVGPNTTLGLGRLLDRARQLSDKIKKEGDKKWWKKFWASPAYSLDRNSKVLMIFKETTLKPFTKNWGFRRAFDVTVGTSICGIRGTEFIAKRDPKTGKTVLGVLDGKIGCRNKTTPETEVTPGQKLTLEDGKQGKLTKLTKEERKALIDAVKIEPDPIHPWLKKFPLDKLLKAENGWENAFARLDKLFSVSEKKLNGMRRTCNQFSRAIDPVAGFSRLASTIIKTKEDMANKLKTSVANAIAVGKKADVDLTSAIDRMKQAQSSVRGQVARVCEGANANSAKSSVVTDRLNTARKFSALAVEAINKHRKDADQAKATLTQKGDVANTQEYQTAMTNAWQPVTNLCKKLTKAGEESLFLPTGLWGAGVARPSRDVILNTYRLRTILDALENTINRQSGENPDSNFPQITPAQQALYSFRLASYESKLRWKRTLAEIYSCPADFDEVRQHCSSVLRGKQDNTHPAYEKLLGKFADTRETSVANISQLRERLEALANGLQDEVKRGEACAPQIAKKEPKDSKDVADKKRQDCVAKEKKANNKSLGEGFIGQETYKEGQRDCFPEKKLTGEAEPAKKKVTAAPRCDGLLARLNVARGHYKNGRGSGLKKARASLAGLKANSDLKNCPKLAKRVDDGLSKISRMTTALRSAKATLTKCDPRRLQAHGERLASINHPWLQELSSRMINSVPIAIAYQKARLALSEGGAGSIGQSEALLRKTRHNALNIPAARGGNRYSCLGIVQRIDKRLVEIAKLRTDRAQVTSAFDTCSQSGMDEARGIINSGKANGTTTFWLYYDLDQRHGEASKTCAETKRETIRIARDSNCRLKLGLGGIYDTAAGSCSCNTRGYMKSIKGSGCEKKLAADFCASGYYVDRQTNRCVEIAVAKQKSCRELYGRGAISRPGNNCSCRSGYRWRNKSQSAPCVKISRREIRRTAIAGCRKLARRKNKVYAKTVGTTCYWCDRGNYYKNGSCHSRKATRRTRTRRKAVTQRRQPRRNNNFYRPYRPQKKCVKRGVRGPGQSAMVCF